MQVFMECGGINNKMPLGRGKCAWMKDVPNWKYTSMHFSEINIKSFFVS